MKTTVSLILVLALIIGLSPSVAGAKLVACVGDSDTYGAGLPDRAFNCYPAQLERLLKQFDNHWETRNFGVSGACVLKKGWNPYVALNTFNIALTCEPDVVVINLGWNDSIASNWIYKDDFITDFLFLIDAFAELPSQPKMYVCYPIPESFSSMHSSRVIRDEVIPLINLLPTYRNVRVVDLYTPLEESRNLFQPDGIHLNVEGTRLITEIVCAFITGVRANPDLNGDGIVDSEDMCIMVDHWHTNEPSCDIAPPPFGDNIVDVQDLVALAEYLFTCPGAVAYWTLNETEGDIANDSVGNYNGTLIGSPIWQPHNGIVGGALQFDGVDDCISTDLVLNPADNLFSVFAWVNGGKPGQTIVSQQGAADWLPAMQEIVAAENPEGLTLTGPDPAKPWTSMLYLFSAAFSPNLNNPPFYMDIPFDENVQIREDVAQTWAAYDLLQIFPEHVSALASLRGIYLDAGDKDELGEQMIAQAFSEALTATGIDHRFEIFDGAHMDKLYTQLAVSLNYLSDVLGN